MGSLLLRLAAICSIASSFEIPLRLEGLWRGVPSASVLGPFVNNLTFGISRSQNMDYLLGQDITYDVHDIPYDLTGYQHFYLEGSGPTAGRLWYCGALVVWIDRPETTPFDIFIAQPPRDDSSVTFCYDSKTYPQVAKYGPFPFETAPNCTGCSCANWTLSLLDNNTLSSTMTTAGNAKHLAVNLKRVGPAPKIDESAMPKHGGNGSFCNFTGVDSKPNGYPNGCPFSNSIQVTRAREHTEYDHCFVLNEFTGYQIEWTVEQKTQELNLRVSASDPASGNGYVAVGFRPLGRVRGDPRLIDMETGAQNNFGMRGADIVVGHATGFKNMYASEFTGPPSDANYLKLQVK
jgi:hypothetical protein